MQTQCLNSVGENLSIQISRTALSLGDDQWYYHQRMLITILIKMFDMIMIAEYDYFNRLASSSNFSLALEELDRQVFSWITSGE